MECWLRLKVWGRDLNREFGARNSICNGRIMNERWLFEFRGQYT